MNNYEERMDDNLPLFPEDDYGSSLRALRAAVYVRMSTDMQKYSTENQMIVIRSFAERHDIEIVREYVDGGRSGLTLKGRPALQQMLADVESGNADYDIILVLDVTRWGRFQDIDESAHYEFRCRCKGIHVEYVGEEFRNDGSFIANLNKNVRRGMAKEDSRILSKKVFQGQTTLIKKGYRQGGHAGYGLRRLMIDEHHQPKTILEYGQQKSLQTDRVILIPGPEEEVETVHWMYRVFTEDGLHEREIAALLNQRGIKTDLGREWNNATVKQVLTNEKYIGNNIYNRHSFKLKDKHVNNPPEKWVRKDGAFEAIVDPAHFYTAQEIFHKRNKKYNNEEMLDRLKALYQKQGWLSGIIIDEADDMPSSSCYASRFGSLLEAYKLIGYTPATDYSFIEINRHLRTLHCDMVEAVLKQIEEMGGTVTVNKKTDLLTINGYLQVSIVMARCKQTKSGRNRWKIHLDTGLRPDITVVVRMDENNEEALDYYLIPALDVENPDLRLKDQNGFALDTYRFNTLEPFFLLTQQADIREIA